MDAAASENSLRITVTALPARMTRSPFTQTRTIPPRVEWRSDFKGQVRHCLQPEAKGREIVELLQPDEMGYFVLKPKHSGFYATSLEVLLEYLASKELVLTGLAGIELKRSA